jgi:hypothetical protein
MLNEVHVPVQSGKSRYVWKNLIIAVFAAIFTIQMSAQDISYKRNVNDNRFYADLVAKTANINGNLGLFGGMRTGYNINNNISIGLIAHGLIPEKLGSSYINKDGRDELHLGYGGVEAVYKHKLSDKIYLGGMMTVGAGRVDYENLSSYDYFFIAEPGVSFNYMITDIFGLGYAVNYRLASGVKYADFSNASFSGWSMDLAFKFGF